MKKITFFLVFTISLTALNAQQTCVTATNLATASSCNYSSHTTTGTDYWLKFTATSPTVNISLVTVKFDLNATHIHNLALYSGNCSSPILVADDELPFVEDAKELAIDLNASGLVVGQSYYLKATRLATHKICDKGTCTANGSTNPTVFDICIQDIDVIIPLDFGLELPAPSHAYITNRGQLTDLNGNLMPEVKLYSDFSNPAVYITEDYISYVFAKIDTLSPDTLHRVDMTLVGGNTTKVFKTEQTSVSTNFYLPHIPEGITGNKSYSRTVSNEVYSGIDMQSYSNDDGVKHYYIVKPTGNADDIIMQFDGATAINVTPSGGLEVVTSIGTLDFEPPHAYRINPAGNVVPMPWQAKFELVPGFTNKVRFKIHPYDPIMTLIIQVDRGHSLKGYGTNNDWSTYYGKTDIETIHDIDVNGTTFNNHYITGEAKATIPPPPTWGQFSSPSGGSDAFVAMFDIDGVYKWATYLGGTDNDVAKSITLNGGTPWITGMTRSSNLPVFSMLGSSSDYYQTTKRGLYDAFIAVFNSSNGLRMYVTYFGGDGNEEGLSIEADKSYSGGWGTIYVVGRTTTTTSSGNYCGVPSNLGFPLCNSLGTSYFQTTYGGGFQDAFIARFFGNGELQWSTYYGGSGNDRAEGVSCLEVSPYDPYVVGYTSTSAGTTVGNYCTVSTTGQFPLCNQNGSSYFQTNYGGGTFDGFVARFNPSTLALNWSTYYGGNGEDKILDGKTKQFNELMITGSTSSQTPTCVFPTVCCGVPSNVGDFPYCRPNTEFFQSAYGGGISDAFIAKFDANNSINWSTYFGGTDEDVATAISRTNGFYGEEAWVTGYTKGGTNFPASEINGNFNQNQSLGGYDFFVSAFSLETTNFYSQFYSTLYGGTSDDVAYGIAVYPGVSFQHMNRAAVVGKTASSSQFPLTKPTLTSYIESAIEGGQDGFIVRFGEKGSVGINDETDNQDFFKIYPNPNNGQFTIEMNVKGSRDVMLKIYDVLGQITFNKEYHINTSNSKEQVNLSHYGKGVYFVELNINGQVFKRKFIIN